MLPVGSRATTGPAARECAHEEEDRSEPGDDGQHRRPGESAKDHFGEQLDRHDKKRSGDHRREVLRRVHSRVPARR